MKEHASSESEPEDESRRRQRAPAEAGELLELTPRTRAAAADAQAAGEAWEAERLYRGLIEAEPESAELCLYHLGVLAEGRGEFEAADELYGQAETQRLERLGGGAAGAGGDQLLLRIRMGIVGVLDTLGHGEAAEKLCGEVAAAQEMGLGAEHPDTLRSQMTLANFAAAAGRLEEARGLMQAVEGRQTAALGVEHPDVLLTRHNLSCIKGDPGDFGGGDGGGSADGRAGPSQAALQSELQAAMRAGDFDRVEQLQNALLEDDPRPAATAAELVDRSQHLADHAQPGQGRGAQGAAQDPSQRADTQAAAASRDAADSDAVSASNSIDAPSPFRSLSVPCRQGGPHPPQPLVSTAGPAAEAAAGDPDSLPVAIVALPKAAEPLPPPLPPSPVVPPLPEGPGKQQPVSSLGTAAAASTMPEPALDRPPSAQPSCAADGLPGRLEPPHTSVVAGPGGLAVSVAGLSAAAAEYGRQVGLVEADLLAVLAGSFFFCSDPIGIRAPFELARKQLLWSRLNWCPLFGKRTQHLAVGRVGWPWRSGTGQVATAGGSGGWRRRRWGGRPSLHWIGSASPWCWHCQSARHLSVPSD